jgi:hypothetical protein
MSHCKEVNLKTSCMEKYPESAKETVLEFGVFSATSNGEGFK